jgi:hypothetical protein
MSMPTIFPSSGDQSAEVPATSFPFLVVSTETGAGLLLHGGYGYYKDAYENAHEET